MSKLRDFSSHTLEGTHLFGNLIFNNCGVIPFVAMMQETGSKTVQQRHLFVETSPTMDLESLVQLQLQNLQLVAAALLFGLFALAW